MVCILKAILALSFLLRVASDAYAAPTKFEPIEPAQVKDLLVSSDRVSRLHAVVACGVWRMKEHEELLKKVAKSEKDANIRVLAELSLLVIRKDDKAALELLEKHVRVMDEELPGFLALYCVGFGERGVKLLETMWRSLPANDNPLVRTGVFDNWIKADQALQMIPFLKSKVASIREQACWWVSESESRDSRLISPLVDLLGDAEKVNEAAAKALAYFGRPAIEPLRQALKGKNALRRRFAAYTLWRMPDRNDRELIDTIRQAAPELIAGMRDSDAEVRSECIHTFRSLGLRNKEAMTPLTECLKHEDEQVRSQAARTIGVFGKNAKEAEPVLIKMARQDPEDFVRKHAIGSLCHIAPDSKEILPIIRGWIKNENEQVIQDVLNVLFGWGLRGKDLEGDLLPFLDSKDQDVQSWTVSCLVLIGADEKLVKKQVRRVLTESWARPIGNLLRTCEHAGARSKYLSPELIEAHSKAKELFIRIEIEDALKKMDPEAAKLLIKK